MNGSGWSKISPFTAKSVSKRSKTALTIGQIAGELNIDSAKRIRPGDAASRASGVVFGMNFSFALR